MAAILEHDKTLYPVVVQDRNSLRILMMAFADDRALDLTRQTGHAHFYSRSRQALWRKGETSGHVISVHDIITDCDNDSFIYLAETPFPVCHRNTASCFDDSPSFSDPVTRLSRIVAERINQDDAGPSYTKDLLKDPLERVLKKVGEEAIEVIIAANQASHPHDADLIWESTDLLYHLSVLWHRLGITPEDLTQETERRHQK